MAGGSINTRRGIESHIYRGSRLASPLGPSGASHAIELALRQCLRQRERLGVVLQPELLRLLIR
jgi:hypothetical protein